MNDSERRQLVAQLQIELRDAVHRRRFKPWGLQHVECLCLMELLRLSTMTGAAGTGDSDEIGRTATPRATRRVPPSDDPRGFPLAGRGVRPVSKTRRRSSR